MIFLFVKDFSQRRGGKAACGECDARGNIDGDPDAPWPLVIEIGRRFQSEKSADRNSRECPDRQ